MQKLSNKAVWIALGIVVGVGSSLLLGANQPAAETSDRYEVNYDVSLGGAMLIARDREENRMLIYYISGGDPVEATLAGEIDLNGLGQESLPVRFVEKEAEE